MPALSLALALATVGSVAPFIELHARIEVPEGGPSDRLRVTVAVSGAAPAGFTTLTLAWSAGKDALAPRAALTFLEGPPRLTVPLAHRGVATVEWTWEGTPTELVELLSSATFEGPAGARQALINTDLTFLRSAQAWRASGACSPGADGQRRCSAAGLRAVHLLIPNAATRVARAAGVTVELSRGDPTRLAQVAAAAQRALTKTLGPVEGPLLIVDSARAAQGGFSTRGLIALAPAIAAADDGAELQALTIAHEVAHQWLGGAIGLAPDAAPALFEGLAQHLAARMLPTLLPGQRVSTPTSLYAAVWALYRGHGGKDLAGDLPLSSYSPAELAAVVYSRVAAGFARAEAVLGPTVFERTLEAALQRAAGDKLCANCLRDAWAKEKNGAAAWRAVELSLRADSGDAVFAALQSPVSLDGGSSSSRTTTP